LFAEAFNRLLQQNRHETDMPRWSLHVRYLRQSGSHLLIASISGFDPQRTSPFEAKTHRGLKGQHAAMHYRRAAFARITARKTPLVMQLA
jgi:hypothetical protein